MIEAKLSLVLASGGTDLVQARRQERVIDALQPAAQIQLARRLATVMEPRQALEQIGFGGQQLPRLQRLVVEHERERAAREIDAVPVGVVEQLVAPRDLEQAIAEKLLQAHPAHRRIGDGVQLVPEVTGIVHLDRAIVVDEIDQRCKIGSTVGAHRLGHIGDGTREHRVQTWIELEQVGAIVHEALELGWLAKIQAGREAAHQQAEMEYVGQCVVMAKAQLPAAVVAIKQRHRRRLARLGDRAVGISDLALGLVHADPAHDVDGQRTRSLHLLQFALFARRLADRTTAKT